MNTVCLWRTKSENVSFCVVGALAKIQNVLYNLIISCIIFISIHNFVEVNKKILKNFKSVKYSM